VIADDPGDVLGQRDPQGLRAPPAFVRDGQCVAITTSRSPVSTISNTTSKMSRVAYRRCTTCDCCSAGRSLRSS
jgi:hypothetical protein